MGIVWLLGSPGSSYPEAMHALMGDFAVRRISSVASLSQLLRIKRKPTPDLLVVDCRTEQILPHVVDIFLAECLPNCPMLLLTAHEDAALVRGNPLRHTSYCYRADGQSFELSQLVGRLIQNAGPVDGEKQGGILSYRDLRFDIQRFQLQILPGEERENLPLKEARLLQNFIENAGRCLSRDDLRIRVWDGVKIASRTIDSHVSRLRRRLSTAEVVIESRYGDGYQLI